MKDRNRTVASMGPLDDQGGKDVLKGKKDLEAQ